MPIDIALPIAHETGAADYTGYYDGTQSIFEVVDYFGQGASEGLQLRANPAAPVPLADRQWNLYAFTHGFLSLHNNRTLALRLPREFNAAPANAYNTSRQFLRLQPTGPQLRHVLYVFDAAAGAAVKTRIRSLLADAAHPGRTISRVANPADGTQTLQAFLAGAPGNIDIVAQAFMNGTTQLFVRAGDVIGNFRGHTVDLRFLDSCGAMKPALGVTGPISPTGRPLNPSYYLHIIRETRNAAEVNMLSSLAAAPAGLNQTHPLDHLLSAAVVAAGGGDADHVLDHTIANPAKPRLVTVAVQDAEGNAIAGRGIPIDELGEWHESRNASNPFSTAAPVRWRFYGWQLGELPNWVKWCEFRSEAKPGMINRLPGGAAFDDTYAPAANDTNRVTTYWNRYSQIFNLVADAFEIPCEILVAIACKETAGGAWYNAGNFANSREMDVIRMEPLNANPSAISPVTAQQARLTNYLNIAGGTAGVAGAPHANGANAEIPVPWNGAAAVQAGNPLTWADLRQLINDFPKNVRVSPGVMQTLVDTARGDTSWLEDIYGAGAIPALSMIHNGVPLVADAPPAGRGDLFSNWFGVSVDPAGANTNVAANVDATLTKMKRALHDIIGGAAHVKRIYNSVAGSANPYNFICDFDFPTVASGYNDAASGVPAAGVGDNNPTKWLRLFALRYYGGEYPQHGTRFFNAAVALFNALPVGQRQPTVRLWRR